MYKLKEETTKNFCCVMNNYTMVKTCMKKGKRAFVLVLCSSALPEILSGNIMLETNRQTDR